MEIRSYELFFDIDFASCRYTGRADITLMERTGNIRLDSVRHSVEKVEADSGQVNWSREGRHLNISGTPFSRLSIDFSGIAEEGKLQGFYKARSSGSYILTTHFEPTGASTFFPCVDEPSAKAIFRLTVRTERGLKVISNTPCKETVERGAKSEFHFEDTPRMSTYLLYLGVGDFVEENVKNGVEISLATLREGKGKGEFALKSASLILKEYERYFGIKYPLRKMHLVAVPEFAVGAMENWGSVTFREVYLLSDSSSSMLLKKNIFSVIAHEFAHQWFGNLVTMKWWNDLWLNESFATFMSYIVEDRIHPEWDAWSDLLRMEKDWSMTADSLLSTHPIEADVRDPEEISQIFDAISYGKGASVLYMVYAYIGEENFREGVSSYLRAHSYGNAMSADLWNSLEGGSSGPVSAMVETWIRTEGYPVVEVSRTAQGLKLTQRRFLLKQADDGGVWPIPLVYRSGKGTHVLLFDTRETIMEVEDPSDFLLNANQTGFYRVKYSDEMYRDLLRNINKLNRFEKWGLMTDTFNFVLAGEEGIEKFFELIRRLFTEESHIVVATATRQFTMLLNVLEKNRELRQLASEFLTAQLKRIGLEAREGEDANTSVLREGLSTALSHFDEDFAEQMAQRFEHFEEVPGDLRSAVAISFARKGGARSLDEMKAKMNSIKMDADRIRIFTAMAFLPEGEVAKALEMCFTSDVNAGHVVNMVYSSSNVPGTRRVLWRWFKENQDNLAHLYEGIGMMGLMVESIISGCGLDEHDDVVDYFRGMKLEEAGMGIKKGLEFLSVLMHLRNKYNS